jgi:cyclase
MKASRISEHLYADTSGEGKGNISAIELPTSTVVVDSTVSPETAFAFRSSLESQIQSPVRRILITHYHADHTLGLPAFKDCDIIACKPYSTLRKDALYQPTLTFETNLLLRDDGFSLEIVHSGGHTADSAYAYLPEEKTLFSGDLIFAKTFFYAGDRTFNPEMWRSALRRFLDLKIERIIPGHGPICDKEEVRTYLGFFDTTCSIMKECAAKGLSEQDATHSREIPAFYPEYRQGIRKLALANWYRFYTSMDQEF